MTWSINASGTRDEVKQKLVEARGYGPAADDVQREVYDKALDLGEKLVESSPGDEVSLSANGHTDANSSYASFSFSGKS